LRLKRTRKCASGYKTQKSSPQIVQNGAPPPLLQTFAEGSIAYAALGGGIAGCCGFPDPDRTARAEVRVKLCLRRREGQERNKRKSKKNPKHCNLSFIHLFLL